VIGKAVVRLPAGRGTLTCFHCLVAPRRAWVVSPFETTPFAICAGCGLPDADGSTSADGSGPDAIGQATPRFGHALQLAPGYELFGQSISGYWLYSLSMHCRHARAKKRLRSRENTGWRARC